MSILDRVQIVVPSSRILTVPFDKLSLTSSVDSVAWVAWLIGLSIWGPGSQGPTFANPHPGSRGRDVKQIGTANG